MVAVPGDFETELQFAGHLLEHVFERVVNALEHFTDVIIGAENCAEAHGNDGVILHDRFDHVLVGQSIIAGGIKDKYRGAADHRRHVAMVGRIDIFLDAADTALAEGHGRPGLNDPIDIPAFLLAAANRFRSWRYRLRTGVERGRGPVAADVCFGRRLADRRWYFLCGFFGWAHYLFSTFLML